MKSDFNSETGTDSMASTETPIQKTSDLVMEISVLEKEILYLERHLLSLYRSAFKNYFASTPCITNSSSKSPASYGRSSTVQEVNNHSKYQATTPVEADHTNDEVNLFHMEFGAKEIGFNSCSHMRCSTALEPASSSNSISFHSHVVDRRTKMRKSLSCHRTLANYFGTTIQDHIPETVWKISEDIIKCISSVYCKLTSSTNKQIELLRSSSSSCTSSSILSPENPSNSWSPQFWCETASSPCQVKLPKHKHDPYKDMIEVPKICIDDNGFEFAFKMLKIYRSLIARLEDFDPRKMEQNEQLAFWLNIHNALMLHAFLAYGLHKNQMRNTSSINRAAYNIGGCSVNIYIIQHLILGSSHPHCPSSHFRSLLASATKFRKIHSKHPYSLDHPEPHAYFALCIGASSDPAVRIYTAKDVHQELNLAKKEYIQAKVSIQKSKIILPKLLYYYAKAASIELSNLIEMASCSMDADEQKAIRQCFQRNGRKSVKLSPFTTDFRFLFHRDLAK
ncbi:uncharacterized protein LOC110105260 isoform X1 [Dendrobium catenatum]|uniref:uncharacterized protein LOC110105260 isoform X1 n=2 Tax=Dendrobium catenatum TaxID=906689 RepID=UPI0009F3C0A6|nr:uncharacterized protein LOC110105260 isoform X1 [Dendrobium catenatum]XP_020690337.1 uncharacterized protein LOC110105260 isoform X1 [Dendrobium catenatum]XP_028554338.1 uncharacterized protein LOC110105260 isoform X1 [Dendrobium catenatum]